MQRKAKIVNISLNSPQKPMTPAIHLTRQCSNQHFNTINDQSLQHLVKDCIEAINVISTEKKKQSQNQRKPSKLMADASKNPRKTDKQQNIRLRFKVAQSVEIILRKFILTQMEENQQKLRSNYSRQKKIQQKTAKIHNPLLLRSNKENTQISDQTLKAGQLQSEILKSLHKFDKPNEKLQTKIHALQSQLIFCKEQLSEKSNLIAKLQSKQCLLKKRFQNQVSKMIRYRNILNINTLYEKEFEQKEQGKYLMNVSGKTCQLKRECLSPQLHSLQKNISSRLIFHEGSKIKINRWEKKTVKTSPTEGMSKFTARKVESQENIEKANTGNSLKLMENSDKKNSLGEWNERQAKKQDSRLSVMKKQLEQFYKQKQKAIQSLNEHSSKIQRYIQELQAKIQQKIKEISVQEQLLTDQELKLLKQDDFQALQLTGFYNGDESIPNHSQD